MNPEEFYAAKWKRIFRTEMLFWLGMLFFVGIGSLFVYLALKLW